MQIDPVLVRMIPYLLIVLAALASMFNRRRTAAVIALLAGCVVLFNYFCLEN